MNPSHYRCIVGYLSRISFEVSRAAWVHYFFPPISYSFCRFLLIDRVGFADDVIILLVLPLKTQFKKLEPADI